MSKSGIFELLSPRPGALATLAPNPALVAAWQKAWHERYASTWIDMGTGLVPVRKETSDASRE